ncbi:uncharacterized protein LOC110459952 isoform X2 [Mizuhopecten yessoensis]|uniref:uncharacterized protein LOC110459952 isoform X2 n=1 Tax=Mizuhopecten yessoensis TaxID=6573 RepID=UPI000B45CC13|nr:uncharacterized protein LOC110459952 isoform X2 [Mizuhopecten yessoensis]
MSSMNYQKVYMNQIHSSSLLCQLSHMWKGQMLCDAIIKTGQVITKAHRVVLVAACPMLQSMENASAGSHLEVRLAADIKQESVNTFLQYLYEGFMMLTEENVRDVEKVGRLLQVDSVIKCCADFYKCMNAKTGAPFPGSSYKYSFSGHDLAEFRHVRATGLQKTASERIIKRVSDFPRPGSPGSKRPRLYRGGSPSDVTVIGSDKADDTASMSHSYMSGAPDPWDRVPKLGSGMSRQGATGRNSQPGVIEIIEERIELVQTEPPEKDSGQPSSSRSSQKSAAVSIAVTSQFNTEPDISVVNVFGSPETQSTTAASNAITSSSSSRGSITVSPLTIFQEPHPQSSSAPEPSSSSSTVESSGQVSEIQFAGFSQRQDVVDSVYGMGKQQKSVDSQLTSTPHQRPFPVSVSPITQPKPFAAGSAVQAGISSPSSMSLPLGSPSSSKSVQKPRSAPASPAERARDSRRASEAAGMHSTADMTPDLSIVKIESSNHETGGLDMHVDMPEEGVMRIHPGRMPDEQEEASDKEIEDWAREEMSNEGSNISGDQNNSWYMGTFKAGEVVGDDDDVICVEQQVVYTGERKQYLAGTRMRTLRDIKLMKEWLASHGMSNNIETMDAVTLNNSLEHFYAGASTRDGKPYTRSTLVGIRASMNRYMQTLPLGNVYSVLKSDAFASSNAVLERLCDRDKGRERITIKKCLSCEDLSKLMLSGVLSTCNPLSIVRKVWFDLTLHFGIKGKEAIRTLTKDSFILETDENGLNYYRLNVEKEMPKIDTFSEMHDWNWHMRMYEIPDSPHCPVRSMSLYISKLGHVHDDFFQRSIESKQCNSRFWYLGPMGHNTILKMMSDISESAGLSITYTNICLKATIAKMLSEHQEFNEDSVLNMHCKNRAGLVPLFPSGKLKQYSYILHNLFYSQLYDYDN